jgi:hypothetical protein
MDAKAVVLALWEQELRTICNSMNELLLDRYLAILLDLYQDGLFKIDNKYQLEFYVKIIWNKKYGRNTRKNT